MRSSLCKASDVILNLCASSVVFLSRIAAWMTMIQRSTWLRHSPSLPEKLQKDLLEGPIMTNALFGANFKAMLEKSKKSTEVFPELFRRGLSMGRSVSISRAYNDEPLCIQRFDPGLGLIAPINPMMAGISLVPPPPVPPDVPVIKEIIHCKSCTLFPQNPNLPPPSTRERPPGCKTVFVGGLPENATEDIIREVFDQCGEIIAIRKSKKNFCHIRFSEEFMIDKALYLSGYRMRIGSSTDKKDSGRIHVDFAQARDDLYEWECKQRLLAREERHRRKIHEDRFRPLSPPPIVHYTEHEAALLAEGLKGKIVPEA
ncbi:ecto-NOX disulfide-thiol exchanger 1 [Nematolebias whitei]|uniref:ecto-NOX disulfide-thiol exchanger 1 n=1 Tax=Nematolebias whitei TaxID=451745 RepID=UPI0018975E43|nr:ecto-NOX disulfide-thiol exchanger 1 [Nematolebias whitei]